MATKSNRKNKVFQLSCLNILIQEFLISFQWSLLVVCYFPSHWSLVRLITAQLFQVISPSKIFMILVKLVLLWWFLLCVLILLMRSAGALAMLHNVSSVVAFGGIVAISGVFKSPLWYVIDMLIGAGIIVLILAFTKPNLEEI